MPDFNALMNPAQIGQGVTNNIFAGWQFARGAEAQNALAKYAENPSMETAAAVAPHDPRSAIQLRQVEEQRAAREAAAQREAMIRDLTGRAAQNDPKALAALWSEDPEMAMKIDDRQAQIMTDSYEFMANAAFDIVQKPLPERPAAWDAYIQQGMNMGLDFLGQYLGKYDEAALNAFVSKAEQMQQFKTFQQPRYQAVGEGGVIGLQYGVPIGQGGQPQNFAPTSKTIGGQTFYQDPNTGKWYDNPADIQGGTAGNGGGSFPGN